MPGMAAETVREIEIGRQINAIQDPEFRSQVLHIRQLLDYTLFMFTIRLCFDFLVAGISSMMISASYSGAPTIKILVGILSFFIIMTAVDFCVRPIHLKLSQMSIEEIVSLGISNPGYKDALLKIADLDSNMAPRARYYFQLILKKQEGERV